MKLVIFSQRFIFDMLFRSDNRRDTRKQLLMNNAIVFKPNHKLTDINKVLR